jgi:hypothetical protein
LYSDSGKEVEFEESDSEQKQRWVRFLEFGEMGEAGCEPDILAAMELVDGDEMVQTHHAVGDTNPSEEVSLEYSRQLELGKQLLQNLKKDDEDMGVDAMNVVQKIEIPIELVQKLQWEREEQQTLNPCGAKKKQARKDNWGPVLVETEKESKQRRIYASKSHGTKTEKESRAY